MGEGWSEAQRRCRRLVEDRQATDRVPGLVAVLTRDGQPAWSSTMGFADPTRADEPPTLDTQFRLASITKTFTAVLMLQLRDNGRLDLDDDLERHLPGTPLGELRLRRLLAHLSGLQREPSGEIWYREDLPASSKLVEGLEEAERVLPPHREWHYSNLAYGLLSEVIRRLTGRPWRVAVTESLLGPLGMTRTSDVPTPPVAVGLFVDPYADRVRVESDHRRRRLDGAGGLWSTGEDLARWAAFMADPDPNLLSPTTWEEMCQPQVLLDLDAWTTAWGLGVTLVRHADRVLVGHGGAAPGFRSAVLVDRETGVGASVLTNASAGTDTLNLAARLVETVLEADPPPRQPWRPGPPVPQDLEGLLGPWWSESAEWTFHYRSGRLEAESREMTGRRSRAVFEVLSPDLLRVLSGREAGERLRIVRDSEGKPLRLYWATYRFTRWPEPFSED